MKFGFKLNRYKFHKSQLFTDDHKNKEPSFPKGFWVQSLMSRTWLSLIKNSSLGNLVQIGKKIGTDARKILMCWRIPSLKEPKSWCSGHESSTERFCWSFGSIRRTQSILSGTWRCWRKKYVMQIVLTLRLITIASNKMELLRTVKDCLDPWKKFSRRAEDQWPSRSPDLNPLLRKNAANCQWKKPC